MLVYVLLLYVFSLFQHLIDTANEKGIKKITAYYKKTPKSIPCSNFYVDLGFSKVSENTDKLEYEANIDKIQIKKTPWINLKKL